MNNLQPLDRQTADTYAAWFKALAEDRGTSRLYRINGNCVSCFPTAADLVMGKPSPAPPGIYQQPLLHPHTVSSRLWPQATSGRRLMVLSAFRPEGGQGTRPPGGRTFEIQPLIINRGPAGPPAGSLVVRVLVAGLPDEVVPAHVAVCLADLVPAFRATPPMERSRHAVGERGEHLLPPY